MVWKGEKKEDVDGGRWLGVGGRKGDGLVWGREGIFYDKISEKEFKTISVFTVLVVAYLGVCNTKTSHEMEY